MQPLPQRGVLAVLEPGRIDTGEATANCAWGGAGGGTLYLTADMFLARIETSATGAGL